MAVRVIRSLDDFLAVPEAELTNCLAAFRRALHAHKKLQSAAAETGSTPAHSFTEFVWKPREKDSPPAAPSLSPTSPVEELGLKPAAVRKFRDMNLYALEDFAQATENELRTIPDVGPSTVAQVRELLQAVGLSFRPATHRWQRAAERAKIARAMSDAQRAQHLTDASDVADLGLKWTTQSRCLEKEINTVGDLRRMTLRELHIPFGSQSLVDLLTCLDAVGMTLLSAPTQLERWRYRAIPRDALKPPADTDPVRELQPWLASIPEHFARAGLLTVGDLRRLAVAGGRHVRGVGQSSWDRVFDYFGVRRTVVRKESHRAAAPPASAARG